MKNVKLKLTWEEYHSLKHTCYEAIWFLMNGDNPDHYDRHALKAWAEKYLPEEEKCFVEYDPPRGDPSYELPYELLVIRHKDSVEVLQHDFKCGFCDTDDEGYYSLSSIESMCINRIKRNLSNAYA